MIGQDTQPQDQGATMNACEPRTGSDAAETALPCVAIAWTPLQQIVLMAMLRQNGWRLDLLFFRDGMSVFAPLRRLAAEAVAVPDISYSARAVGRYRQVGKQAMRPRLDRFGAYRCLSWTRESPLARFIITHPACRALSLFEDGAGTYVDHGRFCWRLGLKYMATKLLINIGLHSIHGVRTRAIEAGAEIYALFPAALTEGGLRRVALARDRYREALLDANGSASTIDDLPEGAILYLPSPFEDFNLLTQAEEIEVNADALRRFIASAGAGGPVLWKAHPHADPELEHERMTEVSRRLGAEIRAVPGELISEQLLLANQHVPLSVVSPTSSCIYTLKALENARHRLVCVNSPLLRSRVPMMSEVYDFYEQIGIEVVS